MIFHVSVQSDNFSYKYSRDGTCISISDTLLQNTCTKFSYHTPSNASCASISVFLLFIADNECKVLLVKILGKLICGQKKMLYVSELLLQKLLTLF